jgi:N-methylhydantoinase B
MENLTTFLQKLVKYGVMVEEYSFHNEGSGYGEFQGGNGQYLTFKVLSDEAF